MPTWVPILINALAAIIADVQAILGGGPPSPASLEKLAAYSQYIDSANQLLAFHINHAVSAVSDKSE